MLDVLRNIIKQQLYKRCYDRYLKELERQQDDFAQWILKNEGWKKDLRRLTIQTAFIPMQKFQQGFQIPKEEITVFYREGGQVDQASSSKIASYFEAYPYVQIAYADEDCINAEGKRHTPWFKPQWSPDTLTSFAYYGNIFAIRTALLSKFLVYPFSEGDKNTYLLFLQASRSLGPIASNGKEKPIASIDAILYHKYAEKKLILSDEDAAFSDSIYEETKYPDIEFESLLQNPNSEELLSPDLPSKDTRISIIIPSKDQPDILETCISSIRNVTKMEMDCTIEIIVVDNGSTAHNRLRIEALSQKYEIIYYYKPMPFNFSRMCNMGAANASGDYLLFLNDDMEIMQPDWIERMVESAKLPHAGAVGAKLLYPDSDLIQHVGVTNLLIGPAHKLLKLHDENVYYHGQNRHVYDMIGVTAACLMVAKDKFHEVCGYSESLAVAYNDVDLCFALYEAGYYNIQRNDVVLYHHESLSRGDDLLSEEKKERLLHEKKILFERHPALKGKDPFYSPHLAGAKHMYLCDYQFEYEIEDHYVEVQEWKKKEPLQWENNCLTITIETAKLQDKQEYGEVPRAYHIEGWSYVLNMDNCQYDRQLLLVGDQGKIYAMKVVSRYRRDVKRILTEQKNVDLAGFVCRIPRDQISCGNYRIAMLVKDRCSNQYLYRKTTTQMVIEN